MLHELSVLDDDQPVRKGHRLEWVVRDQEPYAVERGQVALQVAPHLGAGACIKRGHGLVQQEQARVGREGARQRGSLPLAA